MPHVRLPICCAIHPRWHARIHPIFHSQLRFWSGAKYGAFNGCRTAGGLVTFASCNGNPPLLPAGTLTITEYWSATTCTLGATNSTTAYQLGCTTKPGPVARGFYSNCPQQTTTRVSTTPISTTTALTVTVAVSTTTPASGSTMGKSFGFLVAVVMLVLSN